GASAHAGCAVTRGNKMHGIFRAVVAFCFLVSPAHAGTREIAQELFELVKACGSGDRIFAMENPSDAIAQTAFAHEAGMLRITVSGFRSYVDRRATCTVTMYASARNPDRVALHAATCVANARRAARVEAAIERDIHELYSRVVEQIDFSIRHNECLC